MPTVEMPTLKRFDTSDSSRSIVLSLYERAVVMHPSLLKVVEVEHGVNMQAGREMLDRCGLDNYSIVPLDLPDADKDYAAPTQNSAGGATYPVRLADGPLRTLVVMKREPQSADADDTLNIAMFSHEQGHVDDFETRLNLRFDGPIDIEAAELYAHHFCVCQLLAANAAVPLIVYLDLLDMYSTSCPVRSIAGAARAFLESDRGQAVTAHFKPHLGRMRRAMKFSAA